jgi:hypothetical protein
MFEMIKEIFLPGESKRQTREGRNYVIACKKTVSIGF